MVTAKLWHYYKYYRRWQIANYGNSGLHWKGKDQRQFTGGGAAYQCHALAAHTSAKSHIHFMNNIGKRK